MNIGIIGPTDLKRTARIIGIPLQKYVEAIQRIGGLLASTHNIVIIPDRGEDGLSTSVLVADIYRQHSSRGRVTGVVPDEWRWGSLRLDLTLCDAIERCATWANAAMRIVELSDILIVLGISAGTMMEICWGKWIKKPFVILDDYVSEIPLEIGEELRILHVSNLSELQSTILKLEPSSTTAP